MGGEFVAVMEDVLDLYEEEYNPCYPTVCLDEKPVPFPFRGCGSPSRLPWVHRGIR